MQLGAATIAAAATAASATRGLLSSTAARLPPRCASSLSAAALCTLGGVQAADDIMAS